MAQVTPDLAISHCACLGRIKANALGKSIGDVETDKRRRRRLATLVSLPLLGRVLICGRPARCSGSNWTSRYPWIAEAARKIRQSQFVLDGEAVVLGADGVSDFNALHSRKHDHEVQFCAFDIMVDDGEDVRKLPLSMRKMNLQRLLRRGPEGIFVNPFERGEIGPELFEAACRMGREGLVSNHRDRSYRAGRCDHWIKVKNRKHPAMARVMESFR